MAKKTKVVAECCGPVSPDYKPTLWLDLEGQDVAQVAGLSVGEQVEILVTGEVSELSQNERESSDEKDKKPVKKKTGTIRLKGYRVRVMGDEDNEFKELAED